MSFRYLLGNWGVGWLSSILGNGLSVGRLARECDRTSETRDWVIPNGALARLGHTLQQCPRSAGVSTLQMENRRFLTRHAHSAAERHQRE
jgi:hypothetical protein